MLLASNLRSHCKPDVKRKGQVNPGAKQVKTIFIVRRKQLSGRQQSKGGYSSAGKIVMRKQGQSLSIERAVPANQRSVN
jgi:hypothetical protein